jgi:hypothetical protein
MVTESVSVGKRGTLVTCATHGNRFVKKNDSKTAEKLDFIGSLGFYLKKKPRLSVAFNREFFG